MKFIGLDGRECTSDEMFAQWDALKAKALEWRMMKAERDRYKAVLENLLNRVEAYGVPDEVPSLREDVLAARKALGEERPA